MVRPGYQVQLWLWAEALFPQCSDPAGRGDHGGLFVSPESEAIRAVNREMLWSSVTEGRYDMRPSLALSRFQWETVEGVVVGALVIVLLFFTDLFRQ